MDAFSRPPILRQWALNAVCCLAWFVIYAAIALTFVQTLTRPEPVRPHSHPSRVPMPLDRIAGR